MEVCLVLCMDGLLLHLVGMWQLLVYLGASYGNGKLGDSIWGSHHKSSAHGARRANTPPLYSSATQFLCLGFEQVPLGTPVFYSCSSANERVPLLLWVPRDTLVITYTDNMR